MNTIEADFTRSADTHLIKLDLPYFADTNGTDGCRVDIYLKDESTHPTGSLKHRLARSLFLYGLCNGWIHENTTIVETSSGSTAISEAYFARLLDLPFVAVVPQGTAPRKIEQIQAYGGRVHFLAHPNEDMSTTAQRLVRDLGGPDRVHFMDQFTYAERATDWRSNNNIADSIYTQMHREAYPVPRYIVMSAGTGGTSATLGRYIRYRGHPTSLVVVDPEHSVFYDHYHTHDRSLIGKRGGQIEGIGRPRVEPSFRPRCD